MSEIGQKVGRRLQKLRKANRLTQAVLAERASMAPHTISRIERGEQSPSLEALERLAGALAVSLPVLVDVDGTLGAHPDAIDGILAALPGDAVDVQARVRAALEGLVGVR